MIRGVSFWYLNYIEWATKSYHAPRPSTTLLTPLFFSAAIVYRLGAMSGYLLAISLLSHLKGVPEPLTVTNQLSDPESVEPTYVIQQESSILQVPMYLFSCVTDDKKDLCPCICSVMKVLHVTENG